MSSHNPSINTSGPPGTKEYLAARRYITKYPQFAVNFLATKCNVIELLEGACAANGDDYFKVMSRDRDSEDDDTQSRSSRRRTLSSSNSHSAIASDSLSSVFVSSSGSNENTVNVIDIWVVSKNASSEPEPLRARRLPLSDYIIREEIALECLGLKPRHRPNISEARYKGRRLLVIGTVVVEWAWNIKGLKSGQTSRNTFYVVKDLPEGDVVLGSSDSQGSPMYTNGG
jgi:hypothetical protein